MASWTTDRVFFVKRGAISGCSVRVAIDKPGVAVKLKKHHSSFSTLIVA